MQTQVHINGNIVPIGSPIPDKIEYFQVYSQSHPVFKQPIPSHQVPLVKNWLNQVMDNLALVDGYCIYNGTYIKQEDLHRFNL